jgi:hypothetical protein
MNRAAVYAEVSTPPATAVQSREDQEQKRQQISLMFSPALCPRPRYAQADLLLPGLYGITGNVVEMVVAAGVQTGWPQPLLLTPIINPVCVTMS